MHHLLAFIIIENLRQNFGGLDYIDDLGEMTTITLSNSPYASPIKEHNTQHSFVISSYEKFVIHQT